MDFSKLHYLKRSKLLQLCMAITFFTSGVIINLVQAILYVSLRNISKHLYRKINWYLCWSIYSQLVFMGDWWSNSKIKIFIDKDDYDKYWGKEHAYCVMNHSYEIDWLVGWMICDRIQLLGNCKAYAKKSTQYIPVIGWAWKFAEFVFLERSFEKDKSTIEKQIQHLADHPDPIWLLLLPEGTRFSPEKHKISQKYAEENNLPQLKHHLQPRYKGFLASLSPMRGKVPALYDTMVHFKVDDPVKPTMTNLMNGKGVTAYYYQKRIPMEQVPTNEKEQEKFLREIFIQKDRMRESFNQTGDFFTNSGVERVKEFEVPRRIHSLINMLCWCFLILCPMTYYLIKLLFSGQLLYIIIGSGIIGGFILLLYKTIEVTKISKGSSYGKTTTPKKTQ